MREEILCISKLSGLLNFLLSHPQFFCFLLFTFLISRKMFPTSLSSFFFFLQFFLSFVFWGKAYLTFSGWVFSLTDNTRRKQHNLNARFSRFLFLSLSLVLSQSFSLSARKKEEKNLDSILAIVTRAANHWTRDQESFLLSSSLSLSRSFLAETRRRVGQQNFLQLLDAIERKKERKGWE